MSRLMGESHNNFNMPPDQIMSYVMIQLEFIIEHEGCPRLPLPTSRALYYTDIVYLKEDELQKYLAMYVKLDYKFSLLFEGLHYYSEVLNLL